MKDVDLIFLNDCSNDRLKLLADAIVYDNDGKKRSTEELSKTFSYGQNYPNNLPALVPNMVDELQRFGGNTIINGLRGHGVYYREILEDVCKTLKVNYNKKAPRN